MSSTICYDEYPLFVLRIVLQDFTFFTKNVHLEGILFNFCFLNLFQRFYVRLLNIKIIFNVMQPQNVYHNISVVES